MTRMSSRGTKKPMRPLRCPPDPLVKFSAAYAKAYSLVFRPKRDDEAMFALLQEARRWYQQIPGSTPQSWAFLLLNDTLKGFVDTDPKFHSLMTANS